ncbi:Myc-type, basic helix-loop-helix [Sesbania bispinosa]|nr:Myc-type, basic helix-loop-helix [Sesbania bispinosa]
MIRRRSPIISAANSSCRMGDKKLRKHGRNFRMVSIVMTMENYYDSSWHLGTTWAQCSDHSPFQVPTQILPQVSASSASLQFGEFHSWPVPIEGDRAASASKSHSQAEKRRRDRINAQLATLRKLIPKSDKMDKAALLGSVIDQVKDLKRKAMDVSRAITVPTEIDEVSIDYDHVQDESCTKVNKFKDNIVIKASVCCDDRPELFSELIQVLKGLRLTAVKADIASVGGRIKSILVLCSKESEGDVCLSTLKQSLKSAVTKIASSSMTSSCPTRSKRQRFFLPSHFVQ